MLQLGETIDSKYQISELLSRTRMSAVYKARHVSLGTMWIVKGVCRDEKYPMDFLLAEPDILRRLNHPSLPRIIDIFQIENWLYIVEDYIEGVPLDKLLRENGIFQEEVVIEWGKQLCDLLIYLHSQKPKPIIYRDMKPGNIIVSKEGTIKLIDFGIATQFNDHATSWGWGTKGYAAPEQYERGVTDERTDIYNLGATLYHLATGCHPCEAPDVMPFIRQKSSRLSAALEMVIGKCTCEDSKERYQSALELKTDLQNILYLRSSFTNGKSRVIWRNIIAGMIIFAVINGAIFIYYKYRHQVWESYNSLVSQGINDYTSGRVAQSEAVLKQAIEKMPKNLEAYKQLYRIYILNGQYQTLLDSMENMEKNTEMEWDEELYYIRATAYLSMGFYDQAILQYRGALCENSEYLDAKQGLSIAYARKGDLAESRKLIEELKKQQPEQSLIYYLSAEIDMAEKNYGSALENLQKAILGNNKVARYYFLLGEVHRKMGDGEAEIKVLDEAKAVLAPAYGPLLLEKIGDAHQRAAESEKESAAHIKQSIESYMKASEVGIASPALYVKLGRAYRLDGDYAKAEEQYQKALVMDKSFGLAYLQLGYLAVERENKKQIHQKDYSRAVQYLQEGISLMPSESADSRQAKEAIKQLQKGE